jgi:hypothetical protein
MFMRVDLPAPFSQQGMDLPLAQVKVNVIISQDARELLRDTPGF